MVMTSERNRQTVVRSYEDLVAWQKSFALVKMIYQATRSFPEDERFGLTSQLRRAAVSIPSNIAEGWGRGSRQEYVRFLKMARGSAYETQTQIRLAFDLGYLPQDDALMAGIAEVERLINGLIRSLEKYKRTTS